MAEEIEKKMKAEMRRKAIEKRRQKTKALVLSEEEKMALRPGRAMGSRARSTGANASTALPDEIYQRVLDEVASGRTVDAVCKEDWAPTAQAVYRKSTLEQKFRDALAAAREISAHIAVDQMRDIADAATPEDVQVARLRTLVRSWLAERMIPQHYGNRMNLMHSGHVEMRQASTQELLDEFRRLSGSIRTRDGVVLTDFADADVIDADE